MYTCPDLVIYTIDIIQHGTNLHIFKLWMYQIFRCVVTFLQAVNIILEREHILVFEVDILQIGLRLVCPFYPFCRTIIVLAYCLPLLTNTTELLNPLPGLCDFCQGFEELLDFTVVPLVYHAN